jgi:DNA helicase-2/ATP-dependent DNA helicase PcrA
MPVIGDRLLLLGDPNQMIYDKLPGALAPAPHGSRQPVPAPGWSRLKHGSYRDLLPAVAEADRKRRFTDPAIAEAISCGRLRIRVGISQDPPADEVCAEIRQAAAGGTRSVGVFLHGNEPTVALSAALTVRGIDRVAVGLSESYGEALSAIVAMLAYAQGAAVRSRAVPPLAQILAAGTAVGTLASQLDGIQAEPSDSGTLEVWTPRRPLHGPGPRCPGRASAPGGSLRRDRLRQLHDCGN